MIFDLDAENIAVLGKETNPALVACLSSAAESYKRQLTTLIETSEIFNGSLKIYLTQEPTLKAAGAAFVVTGTPTYILLLEGKEKDRLLGAADTDRLSSFILKHAPLLKTRL